MVQKTKGEAYWIHSVFKKDCYPTICKLRISSSEALSTRIHSSHSEMVFELQLESLKCSRNDGRTGIMYGPHDDYEMGTSIWSRVRKTDSETSQAKKLFMESR
jgi:hypothetical protein